MQYFLLFRRWYNAYRWNKIRKFRNNTRLFYKEQRCEKEGEKGIYITWRDFNLQKEIFLFGKKFLICYCDDFTKLYYMKVGINLNNPIDIPDVIFEPDKFKNIDFE